MFEFIVEIYASISRTKRAELLYITPTVIICCLSFVGILELVLAKSLWMWSLTTFITAGYYVVFGAILWAILIFLKSVGANRTLSTFVSAIYCFIGIFLTYISLIATLFAINWIVGAISLIVSIIVIALLISGKVIQLRR